MTGRLTARPPPVSPQILSKAYAVLSDAEQRAVYDEQGTVDEEGEALRGERDWQEYWRLLFKKVRAGRGPPGLASAGWQTLAGRGSPLLRGCSQVCPTSSVKLEHWGGCGVVCVCVCCLLNFW